MSNWFLKTYAELKRNSSLVLPAIVILLTVLIVYRQDFAIFLNEALYARVAGERPSIDELLNTLHHLQENELVEKDIVNIDDETQLVWKPQS